MTQEEVAKLYEHLLAIRPLPTGCIHARMHTCIHTCMHTYKRASVHYPRPPTRPHQTRSPWERHFRLTRQKHSFPTQPQPPLPTSSGPHQLLRNLTLAGPGVPIPSQRPKPFPGHSYPTSMHYRPLLPGLMTVGAVRWAGRRRGARLAWLGRRRERRNRRRSLLKRCVLRCGGGRPASSRRLTRRAVSWRARYPQRNFSLQCASWRRR